MIGKSMFLMISFILAIGLSSLVHAETTVPAQYGAKGALQDSSITLEEALVYAIQDEYLAQARYDAIISKFGDIRPFNQIKSAELRHITALEALFQAYNQTLPENVANQYVSAPATLKEAFQQGVDGEIDNISMYEKLSGLSNLPQDVKVVMQQLGNASKNHLRAFKRGLSMD